MNIQEIKAELKKLRKEHSLLNFDQYGNPIGVDYDKTVALCEKIEELDDQINALESESRSAERSFNLSHPELNP